MNRMEIYAKLKVPEVARWDGTIPLGFGFWLGSRPL